MARSFGAESLGADGFAVRGPVSAAPSAGCALVELGGNQLGWTASPVALNGDLTAKVSKSGDTFANLTFLPWNGGLNCAIDTPDGGNIDFGRTHTLDNFRIITGKVGIGDFAASSIAEKLHIKDGNIRVDTGHITSQYGLWSGGLGQSGFRYEGGGTNIYSGSQAVIGVWGNSVYTEVQGVNFGDLSALAGPAYYNGAVVNVQPRVTNIGNYLATGKNGQTGAYFAAKNSLGATEFSISPGGRLLLDTASDYPIRLNRSGNAAAYIGHDGNGDFQIFSNSGLPCLKLETTTAGGKFSVNGNIDQPTTGASLTCARYGGAYWLAQNTDWQYITDAIHGSPARTVMLGGNALGLRMHSAYSLQFTPNSSDAYSGVDSKYGRYATNRLGAFADSGLAVRNLANSAWATIEASDITANGSVYVQNGSGLIEKGFNGLIQFYNGIRVCAQYGATYIRNGNDTAWGDLYVGSITQGTSDARWTIPATGKRTSELGNGSGTWQSGFREEYNVAGVRHGFFGATPVARQSIAAAATDAATTQTLANSLRTAILNLGLGV